MQKKWHRYQYTVSILSLVMTLVITAILYIITHWSLYGLWLVVVNPVTFVLFGLDKNLAKSGSVRIPEATLHLFTLLGGVFGQYSGRVWFHHKVRVGQHPAFPVVLIISILLHGILFYFLLL